MTVENDLNTKVLRGTGSKTKFDFDFQVSEPNGSDIKVFITDSNGNIKELTSGYQVILLNPDDLTAGGYVEYPIGNSGILQPDETITIQRQVPYVQATGFDNGGPFRLKQIERALDKVVMMNQQLKERVDRTLKAVPGSALDGVDYTLPAPEPGKALGWDPEGKRLYNYFNPGEVAYETQVAASQAAASATAAAGSATTAGNSATAAANSETATRNMLETGWVAVTGTWTYLAADSFTEPGNVVSKYCVGDKAKLDQSGTTKYYVLANITFESSNNRTVFKLSGLAPLTNTVITNPYISKWLTPGSFPYHLNRALTHIPVRQTVLQGSTDYLYQSSTLRVDFANTNIPAILTFADGYDIFGQVDYIVKIQGTQNAWPNLPTNSTLFLWVEADVLNNTLSFGYSAIPPVYSKLTPATIADTHWFDLNSYKMKRYNGTAWEEKRRLFVGECTTGASNTTSLVSYAIQGRYESIWTEFTTLGSTRTFSHNLGCDVESWDWKVWAKGTGGTGLHDTSPKPAGILSLWSTGEYFSGTTIEKTSRIDVLAGVGNLGAWYGHRTADQITTNIQVKIIINRNW